MPEPPPADPSQAAALVAVARAPEAPRAEAAPGPAPAPVSIEQVQKRWGELARMALSQGEIDLGTALAGSKVTMMGAGTINIACERSVSAEQMPRLRHYLATLGIGHLTPQIDLVVAGGKEGAERTRRVQDARNHPLVKDALKRFEADIHLIETVAKPDWLARLERPL